MIFEQFYLKSLGHASYLIGSEATGEALVLDARRDVDGYFDAARRNGMRIAYACDTHQHNDYVSGICEIPARGDAQLLGAARASLGYRVHKLEDRQLFEMGELVFEVLHTPGHTPEHISLLVTDRLRSEEPQLVLSGGALLVGDVGRPDLLGGAEETRRNAAELCNTLREKFLTLPDHVEVYPTHVSGSLCAGNIGRRLSTTIGYERRANSVLNAVANRDEFVGQCVDIQSLPAVPPYWRRMRRINQEGPALLGVYAPPPALSVRQFETFRDEGAYVLDCRASEAFAIHIPGAINVPAGPDFPTWAGTVLPERAAAVLVLDSSEQLFEVCWSLLRIGYRLPHGWLAGGMLAWRAAARPMQALPLLDIWTLKQRIESRRGWLVLDVRQPAEWNAGHIRDAIHITGASLLERLEELPRDRSIAVVCSSGLRSGVAASLLQRDGFQNVANVMGGMGAWAKADLGMSL